MLEASQRVASPAPSSAQASAAPLPLSARIHEVRSSCLDALYGHQTHSLIPHSSKVVIFDSELEVEAAFAGLVTHDIKCAPVWDSARRKYAGMLSVSDFLDILLSTIHDPNVTLESFAALSSQKLSNWADFKRRRGSSISRLLCISPESTLHEAVRQLLTYRVHRLCVVQLALPDTILRILTNHGILRFLRQCCPALSNVTLRELNIGVFDRLLTLTLASPVLVALEMLSAAKVSSIPVIDAMNRPVDVYSRSDVRFLALDHSWTQIEHMSIEQALARHQPQRCMPLCTRDDSLMTIAGLLVSCNKHSLICVHPVTNVIEGVVSLTDIFAFILNAGPPVAESRVNALMADEVSVQAHPNDELHQRGLDPTLPITPSHDSNMLTEQELRAAMIPTPVDDTEMHVTD